MPRILCSLVIMIVQWVTFTGIVLRSLGATGILLADNTLVNACFVWFRTTKNQMEGPCKTLKDTVFKPCEIFHWDSELNKKLLKLHKSKTDSNRLFNILKDTGFWQLRVDPKRLWLIISLWQTWKLRKTAKPNDFWQAYIRMFWYFVL